MTQQQQIFNHLQSKPITGLEAWKEYAVYRLSEMIRRIINQGHEVKTTMIKMDGHTFAKYSLQKLKK